MADLPPESDVMRAAGGFRAGLVLAGLFIAAATLGPWLYGPDPDRQNLLAALAGPGRDYPLGTDQLGRDILARVLHGARYSAGIAVIVTLLNLATGCILAGIAIWSGGAAAKTLTMFADAVYALPGLLVTILLADILGGGTPVIIFLLWLVAWPEYFRLSSAVGQQLADSDHVIASRLAGAGGSRIFRLQILPVMLPYLLSLGSLSVGRVVLSIATLGFLGIGIEPPQAEWGMMINDLRFYWQIAPVQLAAPVLAIIWIVLALLILSQSFPRSFSRPGPRSISKTGTGPS